MLAYKKLYFEYYPALKEGNFLGELVATNSAQGTKSYELKLPTDMMFSKVHGDIKLHRITSYNVCYTKLLRKVKGITHI